MRRVYVCECIHVSVCMWVYACECMHVSVCISVYSVFGSIQYIYKVYSIYTKYTVYIQNYISRKMYFKVHTYLKNTYCNDDCHFLSDNSVTTKSHFVHLYIHTYTCTYSVCTHKWKYRQHTIQMWVYISYSILVSIYTILSHLGQSGIWGNNHTSILYTRLLYTIYYIL